jgi:pimeloyl-ACP methyl ester carboxylesterase
VAAASRAPHATLVTLDDAGHFDPYNEPLLHGVRQTMLDFLRQHGV